MRQIAMGEVTSMQVRPLLGGTYLPSGSWRPGRNEEEERGGAAREREAETAIAEAGARTDGAGLLMVRLRVKLRASERATGFRRQLSPRRSEYRCSAAQVAVRPTSLRVAVSGSANFVYASAVLVAGT